MANSETKVLTAPAVDGDPNNSQSPPSFDWISGTYPHDPTRFQKSILSAHWDESPLGPIGQWPAQLLQMVRLVIADPAPAAVCWGLNAIIIRNEAYGELLDPKSVSAPHQISRPLDDWYEIEPVLRMQREDGMAKVKPRRFVLLQRQETLEEAYFTWKYLPLIDSDGNVAGTHVTAVDVTQEMVASRRLETIGSLSSAIAIADTTKELWSQVLNGLENASKDIPFAVLYSTQHSTTGPRALPAAERPRYSTQQLTCTLEGYQGIPADDLAVPLNLHLSHDDSWLAAPFKKAIETAEVLYLSQDDGTMPVKLLQDLQKHDHSREVSRIVVCPLYSSHLGTVRAFLVLALSSWRPYDDNYQRFISTLIDQLGISQMATVFKKEEVRKRDSAPEEEASKMAALALELQTRVLEVEEGEKKLARFTARAQVALGILDAKGSVVFANPLWRDLTQLEPADDQVAWARAIIPEDLDETYAVFARMIAESCPIDFHLRFNKQWKTPEVDKNGIPIFMDTHIICSLFPDLDEDGNVTTIMSCLTDISELKWVENQLRQRTADVEHREEMWRNFTDRAPIGLCLLNPDGSLEFGNDTWWKMTKTPRGEKSGLAWVQNSIFAEDILKVEQMFSNSLDHDAPKTVEFRLNQEASNSNLDIEEHSHTVNTTILGTVHTTFDLDGSLQHVVVWLTDITAQKLAENDLRKRMDQAIHMKRQQEKFIDMTSHELRNPLSAMVHCADEIVSALNKHLTAPTGELLDDSIEAANTIIYCAMHQKRIVDDILTLSRLDSDLLAISPEPAMLSTLIKQALKMFDVELKRAGIALYLQEDDSLLDKNVWTLFDPGRVLQVFINLMTNAIKFTRSEEIRQITVSISASYLRPTSVDQQAKFISKWDGLRDQTTGLGWGNGEPIYLSMSVTDTGRGLTQEEKGHLFNVFQQASPKTYVQYGGSGLGLFISRQLVEMHGGEIGVTSEAQKGSTFSFYVKARKTVAPATSFLTSQRRHSFVNAEALREACGSEIPTQKKMKKRNTVNEQPAQAKSIAPSLRSNAPDDIHILVVEDNLINQKVVAKQLRQYGCVVSVANHGEEALAFIEKSEHYVGASPGKKLSVVLMDLEMPVMDGLACIKKIREAQLLGQIRNHIPVIAITANARAEQIAKAMDAGMDHVITKPFRMPDIITHVERLLPKQQTPSNSE